MAERATHRGKKPCANRRAKSSDFKLLGFKAGEVERNGVIRAFVTLDGSAVVEEPIMLESKAHLENRVAVFGDVGACQADWDANPGPLEDALMYRGLWIPHHLAATQHDRESAFSAHIAARSILTPRLKQGLFEHAPGHTVFTEDETVNCFIPVLQEQYIKSLLRMRKKVTLAALSARIRFQVVRVVCASDETGLVIQGERTVRQISGDGEHQDFDFVYTRTLRQYHYWLGSTDVERFTAHVSKLINKPSARFNAGDTIDTVALYISTRKKRGKLHSFLLNKVRKTNLSFTRSIAEVASAVPQGTLLTSVYNELQRRALPFEEDFNSNLDQAAGRHAEPNAEPYGGSNADPEPTLSFRPARVPRVRAPKPAPETEEEQQREEKQRKKLYRERAAAEVDEDKEREQKALNEEVPSFKNVNVAHIICARTKEVSVQKKVCSAAGLAIVNNLIKVAASKVFNDSRQSITELISNGLDSYGGAQIGRFGLGFFSVFGLLFDEIAGEIVVQTSNNKTANTLTVTTKGKNKTLNATLVDAKPDVGQKGTIVEIKPSKDQKFSVATLTVFDHYVSKFQQIEAVRTTLDFAQPQDRQVTVAVNEDYVRVADKGTGMSRVDLFRLLRPSDSSKGVKRVVADESVASSANLMIGKHSELRIYVQNVLVKAVVIFAPAFASDGVIYHLRLPGSVRMPIARDDVILSDEPTFQLFSRGLFDLFEWSLQRKSIVALQNLVDLYVRTSPQQEAYKLVARMNWFVDFYSSSLFVPRNDVALDILCQKLGITPVISNIFSRKRIEGIVMQNIGKQAKTLNVDFKTFHRRVLIKLDLAPGTVRLMTPLLPRVILMKSDATADDIAATTDVPQYACEKTMSSTDRLHAKFTEKLKLGAASLEYLQATWDLMQRHINPKGENLSLMFTSLVSMMNANKVVEGPFLETLLLFHSRMVVLEFEPLEYTNYGPYRAEKLHLTQVNRNERISYFREMCATEQSQTQAQLDVDLAQHRISGIPSFVHKGTQLLLFCACLQENNFEWYTNSFLDISVIWRSNAALVTTGRIDAVLTHIKTVGLHPVECLVAYFLFVYFSIRYDSSIPDTATMIVDQIFFELRKAANLNVLVKRFDEIKFPGKLSNLLIFEATFTKPIINSFPFFHQSLTQLRSAAAQQVQLGPRFPGMVTSASPFKFSVNDLVMFVMKENKLTNAEDLFRNLQEIADFSRKNEGRSSLPIVPITTTYGSVNVSEERIVRELLQNSTDAYKANAADATWESADVNINITSRDFNFHDQVGIDKILHVLIPFMSEKSSNANASGEMGTGFFTLLTGKYKQVAIETAKNGLHWFVIAEPKMEDGAVIDVNLSVQATASDHTGTNIQLVFHLDDERSAVRLYSVCKNMFAFSSAQRSLKAVSVNLNGQSTGLEKKLVYSDFSVGTASRLTDEHTAVQSTVWVNDVPTASLREVWVSLYSELVSKDITGAIGEMDYPTGNENALLPAFAVGVYVTIKRDLYIARQSRTGALFAKPEHVFNFLVEAQKRFYLEKYATSDDGVFLEDFVPKTLNFGMVQQHDPHSPLVDLTKNEKNHSMAYLRSVISTVCRVVYGANTGDTQKSVAEAFIEDIKPSELIKNAARRWFRNKTEPCKTFVRDETTGEVSEQKKLKDTRENWVQAPFIHTFVKTAIKCINAALGGNLAMSVGGVEVTAQEEPAVFLFNLAPYRMLGAYLNGLDTILLTTSYGAKFDNFLAAARRLGGPNKHADLRNLLSNDFLLSQTPTASSVIHEITHHYIKCRHSLHPHEISFQKAGFHKETITFAQVASRMSEVLFANNFVNAFQEALDDFVQQTK